MNCTVWKAAAIASLLLLFSVLTRAGEDPPAAKATLQDAKEALAKVTAQQQKMDKADKDILDMMRSVKDKADTRQMEGSVQLARDQYSEAVNSFKESERLYKQVLEGRELLEKLAKADRGASAGRMMVEATATPDQMQEAAKFQREADKYIDNGEVEPAIESLNKARKAYEALLPASAPATGEQVIAARSAMEAARDKLNSQLPKASVRGNEKNNDDKKWIARLRAGPLARENDPASSSAPRAGSLADLMNRAQSAEKSASEAVEEKQFTSARLMFSAAESLYNQAAALLLKREQIKAAQGAAQGARQLAESVFKSAARPIAFEHAKRDMIDADKALADEDLDSAKKLLLQSVEGFAACRNMAAQVNALADAQQAWFSAYQSAGEEQLAKYATTQLEEAKSKASDAQIKATIEDFDNAIALYKQASARLAEAVATAKLKEGMIKAEPSLELLNQAITQRDKFKAEDVLARLETLIPTDPRMPALRERVAAVPGLKKSLTVTLASNVLLEFILIRPGSLMMGSERGGLDEKPLHKVDITKPYYISKYEVTQAQWQALMGNNPSAFPGPKNPVEQVSWDDCQLFMGKLKDRVGGLIPTLPTEAQWEYACRAGTTTEFCFGDTTGGMSDYAIYDANSDNKTHPVGEKKPNAWGLYDMHGNVWEWCQDWYDDSYYTNSPAADPPGPTQGTYRVLRGGSWGRSAVNCRSASRTRRAPSGHGSFGGFRTALIQANNP